MECVYLAVLVVLGLVQVIVMFHVLDLAIVVVWEVALLPVCMNVLKLVDKHVKVIVQDLVKVVVS